MAKLGARRRPKGKPKRTVKKRPADQELRTRIIKAAKQSERLGAYPAFTEAFGDIPRVPEQPAVPLAEREKDWWKTPPDNSHRIAQIYKAEYPLAGRSGSYKRPGWWARFSTWFLTFISGTN